MVVADGPAPEPDLEDGPLAPGEGVAYRFHSPHGLGLLTDRRLRLFGHPHPVRRALLWSVDLENIYELSVEELGKPGEVTGSSFAAWTRFGTVFGTQVTLDPVYAVLVNNERVFVGYPQPAADLQQRIDDRRSKRCLALYGQVRPFTPGPPTWAGEEVAGGPTEPASSAGTGQPPTPAASAFVLFLAGEPFRDAVPGGARPFAAANMSGVASGLVTSVGGHVPADFEPGQLYGSQAEAARLVLDIAQKCQVAVRVVDVEHAGADQPLVDRWVTSDRTLPLLLRYDGAALAGEESLVPGAVARFLQGREGSPSLPTSTTSG